MKGVFGEADKTIINVIQCKTTDEVKQKYQIFRGMLPEGQFMEIRGKELVIYKLTQSRAYTQAWG